MRLTESSVDKPTLFYMKVLVGQEWEWERQTQNRLQFDMLLVVVNYYLLNNSWKLFIKDKKSKVTVGKNILCNCSYFTMAKFDPQTADSYKIHYVCFL